MKTTQRQSLQNNLRNLESKYAEAMRGRMVPSPKAIRIRAEINVLQDEINRLDRDAAERLALEKAPVEEVLQVIALPLLADVMNDLVADVDAMLRRSTQEAHVFYPATT